jgi:hypothetical protein
MKTDKQSKQLKMMSKLIAEKQALFNQHAALIQTFARAENKLLTRISDIEVALSTLVEPAAKPAGKATAGKVVKSAKSSNDGSRTPRGENLEKVMSFLKGKSKGATQAEIARGTGINPAIISLLLKRHSKQFKKEKGRGGLIRAS